MGPKPTLRNVQGDKTMKDFLCEDGGAEARIMAAIESSKRELKEECQKMREDIQKYADHIEKELQEVREEFETKHKELESDAERREWHDRKYNLTFRGIDSASRNEEGLKKFLAETLKIEQADQILFANVHKLPKDYMIARFVCWADRERTLQAARQHLKGTNFSVQTDLPIRLRNKRTALLKMAKELRAAGGIARVIERGFDVILQTKENETATWVTKD